MRSFLALVLVAGCSADTFAVSAADAGGAIDSPPAVAIDATTPPFCSALNPSPFFCMDFDESGLDGAYQQGAAIKIAPTIDPTATGLLDMQHFVSSSAAFVATTPATTSAPMSGTGFVTSRFTSVNKLTAISAGKLRFALRVNAYQMSASNSGTASAAYVGSIQLALIGMTVVGNLFLTTDGKAAISISTSEKDTQQTTFAMPAIGTWVVVDLILRLVPTPSLEVLLADSTSVAKVSSSTNVAAAGDASFDFGLWAGEPFGAVSLDMDNVTFERLVN